MSDLNTMTKADAAMHYADLGLLVFPLAAGCKVPRKGSAGFKDATSDPERVRDWWDAHPTSNIGIATGHLVDVIDIDGFDGQREFELLSARPPAHALSATVRPGGVHVWVPAVPGRRSRVGVVPHVDYRGLGGYAVAPPSQVNSYTNRYRWLSEFDLSTTKAWTPTEGPTWESRWAHAGPVAMRLTPAEMRQRPVDSDPHKRLDGIIATLLGSREGERNNVLYWCACRVADMWDDGQISDVAAVLDGLLVLTAHIGLPQGEAAGTLASGLHRKPRP